jgi:general secretion pathway protein N
MKRMPRPVKIRDEARIASSVLTAAVAAVLACGSVVRAQDAGVPRTMDSPQAQANPLARLSLDKLVATRERPLFAPTRRPPPAEPVAVGSVDPPPPPPPPPPSLALFGIVKDGEGASALVRAQASDKVQRVRVGDKVDGWEVSRIEERQVVLELADRSTSFTLFSRGAPGEQPRATQHRAAPMVELNAAGILTARRAGKPRR